MPQPTELATIDDVAVRAHVSEILARPEYARFRTMPAEWLRQLLDLFGSWVAWLSELHARSPGLYFSLLIGLTALAAVLLTHAIWSLRAAMRVPAPAESAQAHGRGERDFAAEALACAERGELLEASHRYLLASIALAARSRLLELKPDDGNRAICQKLRAASIEPGMRLRWIELIARTDTLWFGSRFGSRAQSEELYAEWHEIYSALQRSRA